MAATTTPDQDRSDSVDTAEADSGEGGIPFEVIAVVALIVAFGSMIIAVFAMGLAARSMDESRAASTGGSGPVAVSLTEFAISPAPLSASAGGTLAVSNDGNTTHDLTIEGQEIATATLNGGDSEQLSLAGLAAGSYTAFCSIPGHRESGMETQIVVG